MARNPLAGFAIVAPAARFDPRHMRIALVSDTHLSPNDALLEQNWRAVAAWIEALRPDLLVHLGDISANGAHDPAELAHARAVIAAPACDVLFLPGNHDIGDAGAPDEPLESRSLAAYRRAFGPDRWSLQTAGWQLLGLNAQLLGDPGEEAQAQWAWLAESLAGSEAPLGVMSHKPLRPYGPESPGRYPDPAARQRLLDMLRARDLRFVVSGHTHQSLGFRAAGARHVWAPSVAFVIPDAIQAPVGAKRVGAMLLELSPARFTLRSATPAGLARRDLFERF